MSKIVKSDEKAKVTKTVKLDKNQTVKLYQNKEKELQGITQRVEQIEGILTEMLKAETSLKAIEKIKTKEKMLVNIGAGIMLECEVTNKSPVKVMLPGQIMNEKSAKDVLADIDKRRKELEEARNKLIQSYNQTAQMLDQISKAFREMQLKESQTQASPTI
jgi:prefoldin alpha subunit